MSPRTLVGLLVGSHFVPPAKLLLEVLPGEAPLQLVPDPENPYDSNAIRVLVRTEILPEEALAGLEEQLPGAGCTLEQLMSGEEVMLGHVGASGGKPLAKARIEWPELGPSLFGNQEFLDGMKNPGHSAKLGFAPTGAPLVILTIPEA